MVFFRTFQKFIKSPSIAIFLILNLLVFVTVIGGFTGSPLASDADSLEVTGSLNDTVQKSANLETPIILDGKPFSKSDLIADFVSIAFSEKPWPLDDLGSVSEKHDANIFERKFPWLSEYIFRLKGVPDTQVLHKWTRKHVRIGYDWPIYSGQSKPPFKDEATGKIYSISHASEYPKFISRFLDGDYKDVLQHLQSLIPELEKLTQLDLQWQPPDSESEVSDKYARIRIVPVWANRQKNFFKMYRWGGEKIDYEYWTLQRHEYELQGAISFTTDTRSQVDGYVIPEADNGLGMSVCKITPLVGNDMMKALVTECLIRALGLPALSIKNSTALLGEWNQEYNVHSKLKDLDGRNKALWKEADYQPQTDYYPKAGDFPTVEKNIKPFQRLTDYDRLMVRLLYCPDLTAGMSKEQVKKELASNNHCFE